LGSIRLEDLRQARVEVWFSALATDVAEALRELSRRGGPAGDDDLVLVGDTVLYIDGSALRRRGTADRR
jgi:hypothetical protein